MCQKHWDEQQAALNRMMSDDFHDVAGANVGVEQPLSEIKLLKKLLVIAHSTIVLQGAVVEAARISAELSPRIQSTHLADDSLTEYLWTIPNPVLEPLAKLDAWEKENGGTA
jgi:hypothetical protein